MSFVPILARAAVAQAIQASGVVVRVEPEELLRVVGRQPWLLVVRASFWRPFLGRRYQYLTSYKGLAFFAQSSQPLELPAGCEVVQAQRIWSPAYRAVPGQLAAPGQDPRQFRANFACPPSLQ